MPAAQTDPWASHRNLKFPSLLRPQDTSLDINSSTTLHQSTRPLDAVMWILPLPQENNLPSSKVALDSKVHPSGNSPGLYLTPKDSSQPEIVLKSSKYLRIPKPL